MHHHPKWPDFAQVPPGADKAKVKVFIRLNLHGLISVEQAQSYEEEEVASADPSNGPAPMDAEASPAAGETAEAPAPDAAPAPEASSSAEQPVAAKKRVRKHDVTVAADSVAGFNMNMVNKYFEEEGQMEVRRTAGQDWTPARRLFTHDDA